jgi:hypothetical protein
MKQAVSVLDAVRELNKVTDKQTGWNPNYIFGFMDAVVTIFNISDKEMKEIQKTLAALADKGMEAKPL